jgi:hypothetical protein
MQMGYHNEYVCCAQVAVEEPKAVWYGGDDGSASTTTRHTGLKLEWMGNGGDHTRTAHTELSVRMEVHVGPIHAIVRDGLPMYLIAQGYHRDATRRCVHQLQEWILGTEGGSSLINRSPQWRIEVGLQSEYLDAVSVHDTALFACMICEAVGCAAETPECVNEYINTHLFSGLLPVDTPASVSTAQHSVRACTLSGRPCVCACVRVPGRNVPLPPYCFL